MRPTSIIVLTVVAVRAFSGPTGVPTGSSRKATSAEPMSVLSAVALGAQNLVVDLFEFEHKRAAKFERTGQHEYWADPRIHNFGNLGWRGILHALVVPIATHAIDRFAYSGVNARRAIHDGAEALIAGHDEEFADLRRRLETELKIVEGTLNFTAASSLRHTFFFFRLLLIP